MSFTHKSGKYLMLWTVCMTMLAACVPSKTMPTSSPIGNISVVTHQVPTPTFVPQALSPTAGPEQEGCKTVHTITICIQDVKRTDVDTQVKLKVLVKSNMVNGSGNSFIFPDEEHGIFPVLSDEQGISYSLKDSADNYWAQFDRTQQAYFQTFTFEAIPADTHEIAISLPMIAVDSPVESGGFQLDLGANPQPGQTMFLDVTTIIDGQTLHFVRAEFGGDGVASLPVTLYTDHLNLPADIFSFTPTFGDRDKQIFFGAKQGINGSPLQISADLIIPPGKSPGSAAQTRVSGVLNLKAERIAYWYRGPFKIAFQLP